LCLMFLDYIRDKRGERYSVIISTSETFINLLIIYYNCSQGGLKYRSIGLIYGIAIVVVIRFRSLRPSRDITTFL
jgi:hypothetical protein